MTENRKLVLRRGAIAVAIVATLFTGRYSQFVGKRGRV